MSFEFYFEGENIDGDLLAYYHYIEGENEDDVLNEATQCAESILEYEGGGHLDIFDYDGNFLCDVEV